MRKLSKVFCLLFAMLMLFTLSVTAFASNETNDGNIKIEVATDKGSYGATGVAEITATITNVSSEDINNVTAQAVFDDLAPAGKRNSETSKSVDVLKAGESFSFTYKAILSKDEHKLNIFQKIILWFVRLFNGGYNANNNNIDVVAECVTEIEFGKFTAENVVQVGYGKIENNTNSYLTNEDAKEMSKVDDTICEIMNQDNYLNANDSEKVYIIEESLSKLEKNGLIKKNTIKYNEKTNQFSFLYSCGISGHILLNTETKNPNPIFDTIGSTSNTIALYESLEYTVHTLSNSENNIDAVFMYGYDIPTETGSRYEKWHELLANKTYSGLDTTIYECPTVFDFKTAFLNMDYICILEHGMFFDSTNSSIDTLTYGFEVKGEQVTEQTDVYYNTDLYFERIGKFISDGVDKYFITPQFFEYYYGNSALNDSIIFLISCNGFGKNGEYNYGFAKTVVESCGASAVIGFHNSVTEMYAHNFFDSFTDCLLCGYSIGD